MAKGTPRPSDGEHAMRMGGGFVGYVMSGPLAAAVTPWAAAALLALLAVYGLLLISGTPVHRIPERLAELRVMFGHGRPQTGWTMTTLRSMRTTRPGPEWSAGRAARSPGRSGSARPSRRASTSSPTHAADRPGRQARGGKPGWGPPGRRRGRGLHRPRQLGPAARRPRRPAARGGRGGGGLVPPPRPAPDDRRARGPARGRPSRSLGKSFGRTRLATPPRPRLRHDRGDRGHPRPHRHRRAPGSRARRVLARALPLPRPGAAADRAHPADIGAVAGVRHRPAGRPRRGLRADFRGGAPGERGARSPRSRSIPPGSARAWARRSPPRWPPRRPAAARGASCFRSRRATPRPARCTSGAGSATPIVTIT